MSRNANSGTTTWLAKTELMARSKRLRRVREPEPVWMQMGRSSFSASS